MYAAFRIFSVRPLLESLGSKSTARASERRAAIRSRLVSIFLAGAIGMQRWPEKFKGHPSSYNISQLGLKFLRFFDVVRLFLEAKKYLARDSDTTNAVSTTFK